MRRASSTSKSPISRHSVKKKKSTHMHDDCRETRSDPGTDAENPPPGGPGHRRIQSAQPGDLARPGVRAPRSTLRRSVSDSELASPTPRPLTTAAARPARRKRRTGLLTFFAASCLGLAARTARRRPALGPGAAAARQLAAAEAPAVGRGVGNIGSLACPLAIIDPEWDRTPVWRRPLDQHLTPTTQAACADACDFTFDVVFATCKGPSVEV